MNNDLDKAFYEAIIRKCENNNNIFVQNLEKQPACEVGNNFVSIVHKIVVSGFQIENGKKTDYDTSLIIKQLPSDPEYVKLFLSKVAFSNEIIVYKTVIPELKKYSKNNKLPVAKCFHADPEIIVLEDLSRRGFSGVEKRSRPNIEQCVSVLEALAQFHAASFNMRAKEPEKFLHLTKLTTEMIFEDEDNPPEILTSEARLAVVVNTLNQLEKTSEINRALNCLKKLQTKTYKMQRDVLQRSSPYNVINHGDCWINNLLFNGNEANLIDLQICRYSSVAADLSYFLYTNVKPSLLKERKDYLLEKYLNCLHANITEKSNFKRVLTMDWLRSEMSVFRLFGFMFSIWIMPVFFIEDLNLMATDLQNSSNEKEMSQRVNTKEKECIIETALQFVDDYLLDKNI